MSYCRFGSDSNVYLYDAATGGWHCCACWLSPERNTWLHTLGEVLAHLQAHVDAGHLVPQRAIGYVLEEIAQFGVEAREIPYD